MTDQINQPGQVIHGKPQRNRRILKIALVVLVIASIAGGTFALWKWWDSNRQEEAKQQENTRLSEEVSKNVVDSQETSRQAIYDLPPANDSPEERYASLSVKSVTAQSVGDWPTTIKYATEILTVAGYENDLGALMRLDVAYEKTGQTAERRTILEKLKAQFEQRGITDTDEYRRVVEALK